MLTTESSLKDLNEKLKDGVDSRNFRPNVVVSGCPAWDEDRWLRVRLGEVELECFKPCTRWAFIERTAPRCVLTTVHPDRGEKDSGMQPLKKLRE